MIDDFDNGDIESAIEEPHITDEPLVEEPPPIHEIELPLIEEVLLASDDAIVDKALLKESSPTSSS